MPVSRPQLAATVLALSLGGGWGCAAITTSPAWTGGSMAVTGPLVDTSEIPEVDEDTGPGTIAARHILVMHVKSRARPQSVTRSRAEAKKRAVECLTKLRGGKTFGDLVREYSDEPGAAERGGDIGAFRRNQMVKSFSDAAFRLKVGEVSEVVETAYGFHIIKRTR